LGELLRSKSGFDKLYLTILSHFGGRATLIKSQSILKELLQAITVAKAKFTGSAYASIVKVENMIVSTLLSMHEYKEWEYLSKYYDGKLDIPPTEAEEFIALCGERGYSAAQRLRVDHITSSDELQSLAVKRALYWQKRYNLISDIEPETGNFYKVMISSYNKLIKEIRKATHDYEEAMGIIERTSTFLGLTNFSTIES
jgi:hypothetical protein